MPWRWVVVGCVVACSHASETPREAESAPVAVEVRTVAAEAAERASVTSFHGSFVADRASSLAADASGAVVAVLVERGQAVRRGDALVEVDGRNARLTAEAGEAQVALASAQQAALDADCARFEALYAEGAISAAQLERSKAQCVAQARAVDAASAQLRIAETTASRTLVRAPFDGVVDERLVDVGEFVAPATPVIALVATDPLRVRFSVPERELTSLLAASSVSVRAAALPGELFPGTLLPLPPAAREKSRDLVVEARVGNADGRLRPGLSATVELVGPAEAAVAVPAEAVLVDDTVHRLFVVRDGHAVETIVHAEALADGRLAVSPGVEPGDAVVLGPPSSLRDGSAVR